MNVPYLDLAVKDEVERQKYLSLFDDFLQKGRMVGGDALTEYENSLKEYFNTNNIQLVASGTSALYLAGRVLDISSGDEVIIPSLSFYASANAYAELGASCVFADIKNDLTICPHSIEKLITNKTKAIVAVHFAGTACDMGSIMSLANKHNLKVIEDTSQAFGAKYNDQYLGTIGDIGCFSTNCMKLLGAMGDSGFITTKDQTLNSKLSPLIYNGMNEEKKCCKISINHRIDPLQCLVLKHRLRNINKVLLSREEIYLKYQKNLKGVDFVPKKNGDVHYTFTIFTKDRNKFQEYLITKGIETKIEHSPLISQLEIYKDSKNDSSNAETIIDQVINIPCHENMSSTQVQYVIDIINNYSEFQQ
ncbi:MAG: hypothetical protein BM556_03350 [Bacteriovorax sp. MedPE-SWde]|nr:MAG: hypothetical protein BM556_03350 [Bacteriovorax sp. MedPE-SWde]